MFVQRFITDALRVNDHATRFRYYVLVSSLNPRIVWQATEGVVTFGQKPYNPSDFSEMLLEVSRHSVSSHSVFFVFSGHSGTFHAGLPSLKAINQHPGYPGGGWTIERFREHAELR